MYLSINAYATDHPWQSCDNFQGFDRWNPTIGSFCFGSFKGWLICKYRFQLVVRAAFISGINFDPANRLLVFQSSLLGRSFFVRGVA